MDIELFKKQGHELVEWMGKYLANVESFPVMSQVRPGEIFSRIPDQPPEAGEPFAAIMEDFERIVIPGITHWQHPSFFAYFPANSSPPSILAEMITATLAVQAMVWQTSPAAAELEEKMISWLVQLLGLPSTFSGVIQDTASTATLCSLLTAREKSCGYQANVHGLRQQEVLTCYCSAEAHSSVEKAVKIAGIGSANLRKIAVDRNFAMIPEELEKAIATDLQRGFHPFWVGATLGTTGSTAIDPLAAIGRICLRHGVWMHVDAALAGTALLLPEKRGLAAGIDLADSFVFNPHKWMFTNFDCSVYLVKDPGALIQTFEITPEYLKTPVDKRVNNYRDWGIQLGRRFRALKLWFVLRHYGRAGLQGLIRSHISMAARLAEKISASGDFELLAPVPFNTVCFRYHPRGSSSREQLDELNAAILDQANRSGKLYITHTRLNGIYTLRMVIGQTRVEERHVDAAWDCITRIARRQSV